MFVAVASQKVTKGRDRTGLVAYDYEGDAPTSAEIESASGVQNHPEHVMYDMAKWAKTGFAECHIRFKSPKTREIRKRPGKKQKKR